MTNLAVPKGWSIVPFGKMIDKSTEKFDCSNSNTSFDCIELEHIESGTGRIIGSVPSQNQKSIKNKFIQGQVIFGKLRPYLKKYFLAQKEGLASSETWVLSFKDGKGSNQFLYYLVQSDNFIEICNKTTGTKMPRADWSVISEEAFLFPPATEQIKISSILSVYDQIINNILTLISQKQLLKKALMQQLLTGKKRLKGFKGEWKNITLGNLGDTFTGLTGKSGEDFGKGKPYIPYMNIFSNSRINLSDIGFVQIDKKENQNKVQYGDIFFTVSSETPEEVGMASVLLDNVDDLYLNSFCFGFRMNNFNSLLPEFARFYMRGQAIKQELYKLAQGSTRFNLPKTELLKISICIPGDLNEQKKIAEIFSVLEEEIKVLETQLSYYQSQKKGLMQQLLTGKKRVKI